MATINSIIRGRMLTITGLSELVGTKIFSPPVDSKVEGMYITLDRIWEEQLFHLDGAIQVYRMAYGIDIYGESLEEIDEVKLLLTNELHMVHQEVWGDYKVLVCQLSNTQDFSTLEKDSSQTPLKRVYMDMNLTLEVVT